MDNTKEALTRSRRRIETLPAISGLMDMELPVRISLGRAEMPLEDVLSLTTGSIIELNRSVGEPVDIIVNDRVVARGEVVVVNSNYGVRIQQVVNRSERLTGDFEPSSDDQSAEAGGMDE